jgi:hypothetical protein
MFWRGYLAWLVAALAIGPMSVVAQDTKKPEPKESTVDSDSDAEVDDELLEFLGSVDSEDEDMIEYLSKSDETPAAKPKRAPASESPREELARPLTTRPRIMSSP